MWLSRTIPVGVLGLFCISSIIQGLSQPIPGHPWEKITERFCVEHIPVGKDDHLLFLVVSEYSQLLRVSSQVTLNHLISSV